MKKIIIISSLLLMLIAATITGYSYSKTLTDTEYIQIMNNNIEEMTLRVKHKGGSQLKALFGNVDEDYLKPELDRLKILKLGCEGLRDSSASLNIRNKDTKNINNNIISKYEEVINLIDQDIAAKEELLNSEIDQYEKYKLLKDLDYTIPKSIDKVFYDINTLLQKLEIESLKCQS